MNRAMLMVFSFYCAALLPGCGGSEDPSPGTPPLETPELPGKEDPQPVFPPEWDDEEFAKTNCPLPTEAELASARNGGVVRKRIECLTIDRAVNAWVLHYQLAAISCTVRLQWGGSTSETTSWYDSEWRCTDQPPSLPDLYLSGYLLDGPRYNKNNGTLTESDFLRGYTLKFASEETTYTLTGPQTQDRNFSVGPLQCNQPFTIEFSLPGYQGVKHEHPGFTDPASCTRRIIKEDEEHHVSVHLLPTDYEGVDTNFHVAYRGSDRFGDPIWGEVCVRLLTNDELEDLCDLSYHLCEHRSRMHDNFTPPWEGCVDMSPNEYFGGEARIPAGVLPWGRMYEAQVKIDGELQSISPTIFESEVTTNLMPSVLLD